MQILFKSLISLSLVLIFTTSLFATHNRAGDITYRWVSGYTYEVVVRTFTKASSVNADRDTLIVDFGDGTQPKKIIRSNGLIGASGVPSGEEILGFDSKVNFYVALHTYPGPGNYFISMSDPNRITGTINMGGVNVQFYLETEILVLDPNQYTPNNSPLIYNAAVVYGSVGFPFQYCLSAGDADGDSLSYSLIPPLQAHANPIPNYQYPDMVTLDPDIFQIDSTSGFLLWDAPVSKGIYAVAILIEEFRNGYRIGSVVHDFQIIITDDSVGVYGYFDTLVYKTTPQVFLDIGDTLKVVANFNIGNDTSRYGLEVISALNDYSNPDIQISYIPNNITVSFTLVIDSSLARIQPYILTFRGLSIPYSISGDYSYTTDESLLVYVNGGKRSNFIPPVLSEHTNATIEKSVVKVYPNPFTNQIQIKGKTNDLVTLEIIHYNGQVVKEMQISASSIVDLSDQSPGIYIYRIIDHDGDYQTGVLVKSN